MPGAAGGIFFEEGENKQQTVYGSSSNIRFAYGNMNFADKSSNPHLPYITRFIIFVRLFIPATKPLLKGLATAFSTAFMSRNKPFAKLAIGANSLFCSVQ